MLDCLIIDDEISIVETICAYFNMFGIISEYATDFDAGLKAITLKQPSIVILDVNLSGKSGFTLCRKLRETSDVPLLFISVRDTEDDILLGLGAGGDDYITKPFSMAVLLAKVKAMLKRSAISAKALTAEAEEILTNDVSAGQTISFGDVRIDRNRDHVLRGGETIKLKPQELKLLLYLLDNPGRRLSKDELLEKVWGDTFLGEGTLSVHIRHLREKLEDDPRNPRYIKTMWGSGYLFEAEI